MARSQRGGSSRRGQTSSGRSTGGRSSGGRASSGRRETARGGSASNSPGRGGAASARAGTGRGAAARGTTRTGPAVSSGNPALLIGGLVVGVLVIVGLLAMMSSDKGKKKPEKSGTVSLADLRDDVKSTPSPSSSYKPKYTPKPLDRKVAKPRKPASYYEQFVDEKLWNRAKDKAKEAQALVTKVRRGEKTGMTDAAAKKKAFTLLTEALDIANEFLSPVEGKYMEESKHFRRRYDDIMIRWQRSARSLRYGKDK